jgi:hypothetical protein
MLEIMDLKSLQSPLKARYREEPQAALITLHADGAIGDGTSWYRLRSSRSRRSSRWSLSMLRTSGCR